MINETLFDELKECSEYKEFRRQYISQAIYPVFLSTLFTIIMIALMDEPSIVSIIPCIFMILAIIVTSFYAIRAFKAPTIVEKGTIKDVLLHKKKDDIIETSYIVAVYGTYYRVVYGVSNKTDERIFNKGDEVRVIVYGNSKMGYIL